jgi:type IX secretion system PorP/SprF family membrane protein
MALGYVQKQINFNKLTFDNQWNGQFFDITLNNNEAFTQNTVSYLDLNAGLNISWFASNDFYFNTGISAQHINNPLESFYSYKDEAVQVKTRYNFFVNSIINLNENWRINPSLYYSTMASTAETVMGVNMYHLLNGDKNNQLIFGAYYRNNDAAIPSIGYLTNGIKFSFNYDATISSLKSINSNNKGAFEASIVYYGVTGKDNTAANKMKCKAANF